jgi:hypothetical protein
VGSTWRKLAAEERFDLARFRVEKLCQDLRIVTLPGQPWFQAVNIPGEHIFDHIRGHRFLADLVFKLQWRCELFAERPTASSVKTLSIFVFGATDCISNHLRYFFFSLPKLSNSNIVAREPISSIEGRRRSFFSFGWPANTTESVPPLSRTLN